jgi:hypothetical protein
VRAVPDNRPENCPEPTAIFSNPASARRDSRLMGDGSGRNWRILDFRGPKTNSICGRAWIADRTCFRRAWTAMQNLPNPKCREFH